MSFLFNAGNRLGALILCLRRARAMGQLKPPSKVKGKSKVKETGIQNREMFSVGKEDEARKFVQIVQGEKRGEPKNGINQR